MKKIDAGFGSRDWTEKEIVEILFTRMSTNFRAERAGKFTGDFEFHIFCDGAWEIFVLQVKNGKAQISREKSKKPFLRAKMSVRTFLRLARGFFIPPLEVLFGLIRLRFWIFDLGKFAYFGWIFAPKKFQIPAKFAGQKLPSKKWHRPEKILLINGSPRKNGTTALFLEKFATGLPCEKTEILSVADLKISPCRHCFACWQNDGVCVQSDDAVIFSEKVNAADLLVFFVPLSIHSMPASLKLAIERHFVNSTSFFEKNKNFHGTVHPLRQAKPKAFLQFLISGFPEKSNFAALKKTFDDLAAHNNWRNLGAILRPGALEFLHDPRLHFLRRDCFLSCKEVARKIYETGKVTWTDKWKIGRRGIFLNDWRDRANEFWESP